MGFLSEEPLDILSPSSSKPAKWSEATAKIVKSTSPSESDIEWAIASKTTFNNTEEKQRILAGLRWLDLFSDKPITPRGNPLDTLCATLEQKMQYEEGERDFVLLQHKFGIEWSDGKKETRTSTVRL